MVNKIGRCLLDGLFPHHCALCGLPSHTSVPLCTFCRRELRANSCCCRRCAIPLPAEAGGDGLRLCGHCLCQPPPFHRVIAPWLYGEHMAHLIHRWKFGRERRFTTLLAELWLQQARCPGPVDLVVPVPLHWRRLWQRGFNQSAELGQQLCANSQALTTARLEPRALRRSRATAAQSGMNALQRSRNLKGAFTVHRPCDNLRVAIVDDVLTTGATAAAAASVLLAAGASHVEIWCLARTAAPG